MKKEEKKAGGPRAGSGPKLKYGEPVVYVPMRVPASKVDEFKAVTKKLLAKWEVKR